MRIKFLLASIVGMLAVMCAATICAQDPRLAGIAGDKYVISAKAGGVNFVSGTVSVIRKDGTSGHLIKGEDLQIGDRVTTSADGRAEILLNPGSYMRIGGDSSFEFISTDLENLKINLKSGSAIFEVIAADEFRVTVKMPQSEIALTRSGVFRLDVLADGNAKLSVFKGKAFIGPEEKTEVGGGRTTILAKSGIAVSKFDRDTNDALDIWSKERGKELMKANAQLKRNTLRNSLVWSFNRQGWDMYNSFGLWVFDYSVRNWCFLPFGWGWSSPYGWGYNFDVWSCRLPWYMYNQPHYPPSGVNPDGTRGYVNPGNTSNNAVGGTGSGTAGNGSPAPGITPAGRPDYRPEGRRPMPPFERIQRAGGAGRSPDNPVPDRDNGTFNGGRGGDNPSTTSNPSSRPSPPPSVSAPVSAPQPDRAPREPVDVPRGKPGN